jgi:DNA modification methylase
MKDFPNESMDLIISSPPLDYLKDFNKWDNYWDWTKKWMMTISRILKSGRLVILFYPFKHEHTRLFIPFIELYKICDSVNLVPYQLKLVSSGGMFFVAYKNKKPNKFGIKQSIVDLEYSKDNIESWEVEFIEKIIGTTTDMGNLILDPFCGEGKSCLAAKNLECNFVGIDINEEMCRRAWANIK